MDNVNEIKAGNALIAEFNGYSVDDSKRFFLGIHYYKFDPIHRFVEYDKLTIDNVRSFTSGFEWNYYNGRLEKRYDNSWDVLMPVVEHILDISIDVDYINNVEFNKEAAKVCSSHVCCSIETIWKRVVEFIKWFNSEKNNLA